MFDFHKDFLITLFDPLTPFVKTPGTTLTCRVLKSKILTGRQRVQKSLKKTKKTLTFFSFFSPKVPFLMTFVTFLHIKSAELTHPVKARQDQSFAI